MPANTPYPNDSANGVDVDSGQQYSVAATPAFSPLYQQIKALILQSLQSGEWKPSTAIPSEQELAARYRVSQGTVRKAIDELAAENLVVRRQGKGTFVATHAERHTQYRFLRLLPESGDPTSEGPAQRRIIDCKRTRAGARLRERYPSNRAMPFFKYGGSCLSQALLPFWKISGCPAVLSKG